MRMAKRVKLKSRFQSLEWMAVWFMNVVVLGPAGSGKSLLTWRFGEYLLREGYSVKFLNLDPGCLTVPYSCDFDIRERFTVERIMAEEGLGPNGAVLRAMDMLSETRIPALDGDFVLFDTPGQLEVFAFRGSGPKIVGQLTDSVGVFIIDATIGVDDLPSAYLYSLAISFRLGINTLRIVNKVDLLDKQEAERLSKILYNPKILVRKIKTMGILADIYLPILRILGKVIPAQRIPLVSAKTGEGFNELLTMLHEVKCVCGDLT